MSDEPLKLPTALCDVAAINSDSTSHVWVVCLDYGYDGISKANKWLAFKSESAANEYVRITSEAASPSGTLIVMPAEWVRP